MLNISQFRAEIVRPVLVHLGMHSDAAEILIIGTAVQESGLHFLRQNPTGPALGVCQMEPATHDDLWQNYLNFRPELTGLVHDFTAPWPELSAQLVGNLPYAVAMARVHYWRAPGALPDATDIEGLGAYWKQYYNTPLGHGTAQQFTDNYQTYVKD